MPAQPEITDAGGLVGRIEVERDLEAKKARYPNGHIGIAGEVKVELEAVGKDAQPGLEQLRIIAAEGGIDQRHQIVGNQQFFGQAKGKEGQTDGKVVAMHLVIPLIGKLRHHIFMMQDRAGYDVGEIGGKQSIVKEIDVLHLVIIGVNQNRNLGEGEKGNADGKDDR